MKILTERADRITVNSVCAIGGFDGVHRGHQAIIDRVMEIAGSERRAGVITFIPLPFFVTMGKPEICLTSRPEKEAVLGTLGVDFMYYFRFTAAFSAMSPDRFVARLAERIKPRAIVTGEDFRFGSGREGTIRLLRELAVNRFAVYTVPPVTDGEIISSTRIRELLLLGNIQAANRLLGREYEIHGRVIRGKGRGQSLGFPTINLRVAEGKLVPLDGVYAGLVFIGDLRYRGAMFCRHRLIEVHIVDFKGDLYDHRVKLTIQRRIRAIRRFNDDRDLVKAIVNDVALVRKYE